MKQEKYTSKEFQAAIKNKSITVGEKKGDKEKAHMESVIKKVCISDHFFDTEFKFSDTRKFKFDWVILSGINHPKEIKIAIEYEGLMSEKSGHTTVTGYTSNCDKYNLACILGWRVLRYTALNYKNIENDLKELL